MGVLGWPPSEFWSATPYDFWSAMRGWRKANGLEKKSQKMDNEVYQELLESMRKQIAKDTLKKQRGGKNGND